MYEDSLVKERVAYSNEFEAWVQAIENDPEYVENIEKETKRLLDNEKKAA